MHNYTNQRDGSFGLWFVSDALIHCCLHRNMTIQTKRTVPLVCGLFVVCFRRVDTLLFAPKHDNTNQKNRPFGLPLVCGLFPMR